MSYRSQVIAEIEMLRHRIRQLRGMNFCSYSAGPLNLNDCDTSLLTFIRGRLELNLSLLEKKAGALDDRS